MRCFGTHGIHLECVRAACPAYKTALIEFRLYNVSYLEVYIANQLENFPIDRIHSISRSNYVLVSFYAKLYFQGA